MLISFLSSALWGVDKSDSEVNSTTVLVDIERLFKDVLRHVRLNKESNEAIVDSILCPRCAFPSPFPGR